MLKARIMPTGGDSAPTIKDVVQLCAVLTVIIVLAMAIVLGFTRMLLVANMPPQTIQVASAEVKRSTSEHKTLSTQETLCRDKKPLSKGVSPEDFKWA